jgi:BlaI family transcriptional regulator, penicillinase repressor
MARPPDPLSRRERQIMDLLHERGRATAAELHERLPDAPTPTAVRTMIRILEAKGHVRHEVDGRRHVYFPAKSPKAAQTSALRHLLRTFFGGSTRGAVAALLDLDDRELSAAERRQVAELIRRSEASGR